MTGRGQSVSVERQPKDCDQWKANGKCTKTDACSLRHDESKRGKSTRWSSPSRKTQTKSEENSATGRSLPGVSTFGKRHRRPCKDYLDGNCTNPSCDSSDPPVCQSYCKFLEKCLFLQKEADHQLNKRPKKGVRKGSVGLSKNAKLLNCVFHEIGPPKFNSILRKGTKPLGPERCVQSTLPKSKVHRLVCSTAAAL